MPQQNKPQPNDIVYYIIGPHFQRTIITCIVSDIIHSQLYIDKLIPKDTRLVNGTPINDFQQTQWQPLPKHWTYNTPLYNLTYEPIDAPSIPLNDKAAIKKALSDGTLIKAVDKLHCIPDVEFDNNRQYRIVLKYDHTTAWHDYTIIVHDPNRLFLSYEAAQLVLKREAIELDRQARLTDEEWSIEQIDHTLNHWAKLYGVPSKEKEAYRDYILALPNIEDVAVRLYCGHLEWKYDSRRRPGWTEIIL